MVSGRTIKFALFEVLQFAGLCIPVFVVMQRFASVVSRIKSNTLPPGDGVNVYWLMVASSVAYVTTITLLVWVPLKYMMFRERGFFAERTNWRPVTLVYVLLSTLPCFALLIAGSQFQVHHGVTHDLFIELPVSLVLLSLICVDIIERICHCRLTGQADGPERETSWFSGPVLTRMEQVPSVASWVSTERAQNGASGNRFISDLPGNQERRFSLLTHSIPGPFKFMCRTDLRAEILVDAFLFWLDTAEMLRVAGNSSVFYSSWVFPVYIFSFLSTLRLIFRPPSPLISSFGVVLQDIPFFFVRIALIATFGFVTPLLYLVKNLLVSVTFIYFNFLARLRIFNKARMF